MNKHASIKIISNNGQMQKVYCSYCKKTYSQYELQHIIETGRCVECGAIFDGEEKNEVQKNEHIK